MSDVKTSTFTTDAVQLYAEWTQTPSDAKTFVRVDFGTLTESEADLETSLIYNDPNQRHLHAEDHMDVTDPESYDPNAGLASFYSEAITVQAGDSSRGQDPSTAYVYVNAEFAIADPDPYSSIRGKSVQEVGLYVNVSPQGEEPVYKLMWLGKLDAVSIPDPNVTARMVSINVTVPVKFTTSDIPGVIQTDNSAIFSIVEDLEDKLSTLAPVTVDRLQDENSMIPGWTRVGEDIYWVFDNTHGSQPSGDVLNFMTNSHSFLYCGTTKPYESYMVYFRLVHNNTAKDPVLLSSADFSLELSMLIPPIHLSLFGNTSVLSSSYQRIGSGFGQCNIQNDFHIAFRLRPIRRSLNNSEVEDKYELCLAIMGAEVSTRGYGTIVEKV